MSTAYIALYICLLCVGTFGGLGYIQEVWKVCVGVSVSTYFCVYKWGMCVVYVLSAWCVSLVHNDVCVQESHCVPEVHAC